MPGEPVFGGEAAGSDRGVIALSLREGKVNETTPAMVSISTAIVLASMPGIMVVAPFRLQASHSRRIHSVLYAFEENSAAPQLFDWQTELLRDPKVRVGPSSLGKEAGDGVFACRNVHAGDTLTWIEYVYSLDEVSRNINVYTSSYFDWYDQYGGYELSAKTRRSPETDGVGHIINDAARLAPIEWTAEFRVESGETCVDTYMYDSERGANVEIVMIDEREAITIGDAQRSSLQRVVARRDIQAGEELFRCYGCPYWLRPAEYSIHFLMDFARVDLRLAAAASRSERLLDRSRQLFDDLERRLSTLTAVYDTVANELQLAPFDRRHPHTHYDGYEVWLWAHLVPSDLRRHYADRLGVYKEPFLLPHLTTAAMTPLASLHYLDGAAFGNLLRRDLDPPFDQTHDLRCQDILQTGGRSFLAFGQHKDSPW